MIYKLAFDRDGSQPAAYHLNILCTCRAIHEEAVALAYNRYTRIIHIKNPSIGNNGYRGLHFYPPDRADESRRTSWRIRRQQSSLARQLDSRVAEIRPQIAATITVLQIHEVVLKGPYETSERLLKRLVPEVLTVAERLSSFINLRKFSWTIYYRILTDHHRYRYYIISGNVGKASKECAAGVLSKIVRVLPRVLQKWPLLEELIVNLPKCRIDISLIMLALREHIPDDCPHRTRQTQLNNAPPCITAGDDALAESSQLRLRTNRMMANSDIVLRIGQDVPEQCQCIRNRI